MGVHADDLIDHKQFLLFERSTMPQRRATKVTTKPAKSFVGLDYPSSSEMNVPPEDFDEYIRCFYGAKGIGKTTTAASFPGYLTLMFETRRKNLRIRQVNLQKYTAKQIMEGATDVWEQIKLTTDRWIEDSDVKGLNFDSIDIAYECCYHSICASNSVTNPGEAGKSSSDVWIEIRDEWACYFDLLASTRLGINFLSHVKERDIDTIDGAKQGQQSPSCSPACLQYIRQACDFVFYYGFYNDKRTMALRDPTNMALCAVGTPDHFNQPNGKPILMLEIPNVSSKVTPYERLLSAFHNNEWDVDTPEEERGGSVPKKRRR
jgi:hypothetical protein